MTTNEQELLKVLAQSRTWDALNSLMRDMISKWQISSESESSEWGYMRDSLKKDGRIEGLGMLFREVESLLNKKK